MSLASIALATEREVRVWSKLWVGSVFSTVVAPVLLLVAMGVGLGDLVDTDPERLEGLAYLDFIAPGLLVATAVQSAAGSSLWPVMAGHKWLGYHHAMVSTPLRPEDAFGGQVIFSALRSGVAAAVFVVAATALGGVTSWWAPVTVPVAVLTAMAFAAPLTAFAATQDSDALFEVVIRVGVVPLYLFSGTLFSVEQLPALLRVATAVFPLWHGVELARAATTGTWSAIDAGHVTVLVGFVVAGWLWGRRTFRRRLTP